VIKILILARTHQIPQRQIIISPRGHLHQGALSLKPTKKQVFLRLARFAGLYNNLIWHASNSEEMTDIVREFGPKTEARIRIISNLAAPEQTVEQAARPFKQPGEARLIFLSRISRKKNLGFALSLLHSIEGKIQFDIYGPIEEADYWQECFALIGQLPSNIRVEYKDVVPFDQVADIFSEYHLFLLPTLGENFGHAILESLRAGCPVLISDQTPWTNDVTAKGIGWAFPLDQVSEFGLALQTMVDMDMPTFEEISSQAQLYGNHYDALPLVEQMQKLFNQAAFGKLET
jgi:glycosyltransferase involved in cell wall biosynthesis